MANLVESEACEKKEPVPIPLFKKKSMIMKADICFDSKRRIGCPICPLYKYKRRDL